MATDNKYDRQLRLWGASGQKALSSCCVVLINCTASGTETLKNLVLPGIGRFHIIDDKLVKPSRSNEFSNFFVYDHDEIQPKSQKSRAEIATLHLQELNPDVKGSYTSVDSLATTDFSSLFTTIQKQLESDTQIIVVAADLPPPILKTIAGVTWGGGRERASSPSIPLVIVKSFGLIGSVRVQVPYHPIVESKRTSKPDLRLTLSKHEFPELHQFVGEFNLDELSNEAHGHVPFVIILIKALDKWRKSENIGNEALPKTFKEKSKFKEIIKSMARDHNNELNFQEAEQNDYLAYSIKEMSSEVQDLLSNIGDIFQNDKSCLEISTFDVLLLALKRFIETNGGEPPFDGGIPDMTSATQPYIRLQEIYKSRAEMDRMKIKGLVEDIVNEYSSKGLVIPSISNEYISTFCKNIHNLQLLQTRSFTEEFNFSYSSLEQKEEILGDIAAATYDPYEVPEHTPLLWFIALRACEAFYDEYGQYPGKKVTESDVSSVHDHIIKILQQFDLINNDLIQSTILSNDNDKSFARELVRYNNAEVHTVASIVGGIASQEAVKLVTKQYVPISGTYIYNGIAGVADVYTF